MSNVNEKLESELSQVARDEVNRMNLIQNIKERVSYLMDQKTNLQNRIYGINKQLSDLQGYNSEKYNNANEQVKAVSDGYIR